MKALKNFIYILYALFIVLSILLIFFDEAILGLFNVANDPEFWKGWLILALLLFILDIIVENIHLAARQREMARLQRELDKVKARYYDEIEARQADGKPTSARDEARRRDRSVPDYPAGTDPDVRYLPSQRPPDDARSPDSDPR